MIINIYQPLRDNIAKERKLRSATDSEAGRATLQKKLALLQRDTSGKSDPGHRRSPKKS